MMLCSIVDGGGWEVKFGVFGGEAQKRHEVRENNGGGNDQRRIIIWEPCRCRWPGPRCFFALCKWPASWNEVE